MDASQAQPHIILTQVFVFTFLSKKSTKMSLIDGKYFFFYVCLLGTLLVPQGAPNKTISILSTCIKAKKVVTKTLSLFCKHHKRQWFQRYPPCSKPQEEFHLNAEPHTTAEPAEVIVTVVGGWQREVTQIKGVRRQKMWLHMLFDMQQCTQWNSG